MSEEAPHGICSDRVLNELQGIRDQVKDIRHDFTSQTQALTRLADKLSDYIDLQSRSIPLRLVFLLFALVFGLVFGVEVVQTAIKHSFAL